MTRGPARTTARSTVVDVDTPAGPARIHLTRPVGEQRGVLVLTHGAGGRLTAPELAPIRGAMAGLGWAVALVEQAWAVAGQKMPPKPPTQDPAWLPVVATLRSGRRRLQGPMVVGGKSNGARVACRTAHESGADGVLALSFPLHPPGRPEVSRAEELRAPLPHGIPLHVVQGVNDPFGTPDEVRAELPDPSVVTAVAGAHSFPRNPADAVTAVERFLTALT
jgi:predicted alpha/beta-hydrolase family hydrolase